MQRKSQMAVAMASGRPMGSSGTHTTVRHDDATRRGQTDGKPGRVAAATQTNPGLSDLFGSNVREHEGRLGRTATERRFGQTTKDVRSLPPREPGSL